MFNQSHVSWNNFFITGSSGGPDGENLMFKALFGKPLASANIMKQQGEHQAFNQMSNSNEVYGNIILMSDINDNTVLYTDIGYSSSSITTAESGITKEYLSQQGSKVDVVFPSKISFSGIDSIKEESFYLQAKGDLTDKVDLTLYSASDKSASYSVGSLSINFEADGNGKASIGEFNGLKGVQLNANYDANVCNGNLPSEIQSQCCHSTTMHEEL